MEINRYERIWMGISIVAIVFMLVGVTMAGFSMGVQMPGEAGIVDPRNLKNQPPFDQPGLVDKGGGKYEAVIVAQTWQFNPTEIKVPAGAEVKFKITSRDVTHGLIVENTNINTMIVPGQVTEFTVRFAKSGSYLMVCHEYCGVGHQAMAGKIIVEP